jgi:hypothetical protein
MHLIYYMIGSCPLLSFGSFSYFNHLFREHRCSRRTCSSCSRCATLLCYSCYNPGDIFPLWIYYLYVATFQKHLHMEYTSLSCSDISDLMAPIMISLIEHWLLTRKLLNTTDRARSASYFDLHLEIDNVLRMNL